MSPGDVPAEVVPVGSVHEVACAVVVAHLGAVVGLPARPGPALPLDPAAGPRVDATALIRLLAEERPPDRLRVGVTDLDLSLPVFTHLYGEADVGGGVAVASLYRLQADAAPRHLVYQRLAKVACHEAGHALGLRHCNRPGCLMRFAGRLEALDRLALAFCDDCAAALAVGRALLAEARRDGGSGRQE